MPSCGGGTETRPESAVGTGEPDVEMKLTRRDAVG